MEWYQPSSFGLILRFHPFWSSVDLVGNQPAICGGCDWNYGLKPDFRVLFHECRGPRFKRLLEFRVDFVDTAESCRFIAEAFLELARELVDLFPFVRFDSHRSPLQSSHRFGVVPIFLAIDGPDAVLEFPVDTALPCLLPSFRRVFSLFLEQGLESLIRNVRESIRSVIDSKGVIIYSFSHMMPWLLLCSCAAAITATHHPVSFLSRPF